MENVGCFCVFGMRSGVAMQIVIICHLGRNHVRRSTFLSYCMNVLEPHTVC